jgi:enoyl-CoA hydratase
MSYQHILVQNNFRDHGHIAIIQLNRPKVLNALSSAVMNEVVDALWKLEDDNNVRVIILTGDDRAFAAGADIAEMQNDTPIDQIAKNRMRSWNFLTSFSKPIIAAVNGFALGGGCELAMACDMIIAGDKAKFGQPEIKIGTIPGAGGTQRLTRAIGKSKAMYYILTGEMIPADVAYEWGLVAKVVPSETLLQETYEVAKNIAAKAPIALKLAKEAVNKSYEMTLKDGLDFERRNFYLTFSSLDQKEGMTAFVEKREANFKGN